MNKDELHRKIKDTEKPPENAEGESAGRKSFVRHHIPNLNVFLVIIAIIIALKLPDIVDFFSCGCKPSNCSLAEQDAMNVLAALASYFSEPENRRIPTVKVLISDADLSLNNPAGNVILFPAPGNFAGSQPISVMVIDDSERCPRNDAYIATMGGGVGSWE